MSFAINTAGIDQPFCPLPRERLWNAMAQSALQTIFVPNSTRSQLSKVCS
jgi:hypothetical protein